MPVPTADLFDKQQRTQTNGTNASNSAANPTEQNNDSYFGTASGSSANASHDAEPGRVLTKEEADRLYEERMEEEYAKRDGGA
jgi:hypothetical protein